MCQSYYVQDILFQKKIINKLFDTYGEIAADYYVKKYVYAEQSLETMPEVIIEGQGWKCIGNILATENQQAIINDVIEVKSDNFLILI